MKIGFILAAEVLCVLELVFDLFRREFRVVASSEVIEKFVFVFDGSFKVKVVSELDYHLRVWLLVFFEAFDDGFFLLGSKLDGLDLLKSLLELL
jgi:hypothetical protein